MCVKGAKSFEGRGGVWIIPGYISIAVSVCVIVVLFVLVAGVGFVVPVFVCLYGENIENPLLSVQQSNNNNGGNAK